jgi:phosphoribosylglycinamide formyltransferase-1
MTRRRVAILISGRGSNMNALIDAARADTYPAEIALVLSNRPEAAGLERAKANGIATEAIVSKGFPSREAFDEALDARLRAAGIELICLAGFMRILSAKFVDAWRNRLINIHPSLLPLFPGLDTHARALAAGVRIHGCTVHFVRAEVDSGPIIAQAAVRVVAADTAETLANRVLAVEHETYPFALSLVAGDKARVVDERVIIEHPSAQVPGPAMVSPFVG